jgi:hypothetical protein
MQQQGNSEPVVVLLDISSSTTERVNPTETIEDQQLKSLAELESSGQPIRIIPYAGEVYAGEVYAGEGFPILNSVAVYRAWREAQREALRPSGTNTGAAIHYALNLDPGCKKLVISTDGNISPPRYAGLSRADEGLRRAAMLESYKNQLAQALHEFKGLRNKPSVFICICGSMYATQLGELKTLIQAGGKVQAVDLGLQWNSPYHPHLPVDDVAKAVKEFAQAPLSAVKVSFADGTEQTYYMSAATDEPGLDCKIGLPEGHQPVTGVTLTSPWSFMDAATPAEGGGGAAAEASEASDLIPLPLIPSLAEIEEDPAQAYLLYKILDRLDEPASRGLRGALVKRVCTHRSFQSFGTFGALHRTAQRAAQTAAPLEPPRSVEEVPPLLKAAPVLMQGGVGYLGPDLLKTLSITCRGMNTEAKMYLTAKQIPIQEQVRAFCVVKDGELYVHTVDRIGSAPPPLALLKGTQPQRDARIRAELLLAHPAMMRQAAHATGRATDADDEERGRFATRSLFTTAGGSEGDTCGNEGGARAYATVGAQPRAGAEVGGGAAARAAMLFLPSGLPDGAAAGGRAAFGTVNHRRDDDDARFRTVRRGGGTALSRPLLEGDGDDDDDDGDGSTPCCWSFLRFAK